MNYIKALTHIHNIINPRNYFEIGCRHGYSLALANCKSIGVDPDFEIKSPISSETRLFRQTSDSFFLRPDIKDILAEPIDFGFIDGMHLVDYALRDFMNIERNTSPQGIIAIDDVLPSDLVYATRERNTQIWTGDVYRLIYILREYRPDLEIAVYDVEMKGLGIINKLDPKNRRLEEAYDEILNRISSNEWCASSAEEIRRELRPRSVDTLSADLEQISLSRKDCREPLGTSSGVSLYIELLKKSVLNEIYLDDELRIHYLRSCIQREDTFDHEVLHDIRNKKRDMYDRLAQSRSVGQFFERKIQNAGFNHSMMGRARLDNLHHTMDLVLEDGISGDFVECGVWRGGGCIFMAGYLRAHGINNRRVVVADSFEGLPEPTNPNDAGLDLSKAKFPQLAVSLETVRENFSAYGLEDANILFLKGWFKDTLTDERVGQIALLRMDGDLYESTIDTLTALYDKVSPGGIVIIDDYNAIPSCRKAVVDYFASRNEDVPKLSVIDWTGVWFRKPSRLSSSLPATSKGASEKRLSVIICVHNMEREAPRSIMSAVAPYQIGVDLGDYEIIVIDNGSKVPFSLPDVPSGVKIYRIANAHPSPVFAMNQAARDIAKGDKLLFAIDGARIFSSGLYKSVLRAHDLVDDAFVFSLAWHLGPKLQSVSVAEGYSAEVEDRLIEQCGWPDNRDGLFDVSVFAGSSQKGFFRGIAESNAFSMSRDLFLRHGGYDERFTSPGAGLANLEIFERYVCRRNARNVCLLSEGTFHQVHDSVATSGKRPWATFDDEYRSIFGRSYAMPIYDTVYYGSPRPALRAHLLASLDHMIEGSARK